MYVGANALVAVFSYLVIVGRIQRVELKDGPTQGGSARNEEAPASPLGPQGSAASV